MTNINPLALETQLKDKITQTLFFNISNTVKDKLITILCRKFRASEEITTDLSYYNLKINNLITIKTNQPCYLTLKYNSYYKMDSANQPYLYKRLIPHTTLIHPNSNKLLPQP